jgi:hypothetical protein
LKKKHEQDEENFPDSPTVTRNGLFCCYDCDKSFEKHEIDIQPVISLFILFSAQSKLKIAHSNKNLFRACVLVPLLNVVKHVIVLFYGILIYF